jgi:tetratricopeptide (TPR) repeat protein
MQISTRIGLFDIEHARHEEAVSMLERALACTRRLIELYPDSSAFRADLPKRIANVGYALIMNGRPEEGVAMVVEAQGVCEENARREPDVPGHRRYLAHTGTVQMEGLLRMPGMADSAIAVTRRAIAIYDEFYRENRDDTDAEMHIASGYFDLARIYSLPPFQADSAIANAHKAHLMIREIANRDPGNQAMLVSVAFGESGEGLLRAKAGQTTEAETLLRTAATKLEAWAREDTTDARYSQNLTEVYLGLGLVEMSRARAARADSRPHWNEARAWLSRSHDLYTRVAPQAPGDVTAEEGELIERSLAACDSALAVQ